jgi:hypothetical protein
MEREPDATQPSSVQGPRPTRPKLDPRLALLLSLPDEERRALKAEEDARLVRLSEEIDEAFAALAQVEDKDREMAVARLRTLDRQLFAPLTAGLFIPSETTPAEQWPIRMNEPFAAVFLPTLRGISATSP